VDVKKTFVLTPSGQSGHDRSLGTLKIEKECRGAFYKLPWLKKIQTFLWSEIYPSWYYLHLKVVWLTC